jgi:hypothetical protein
MAKKNIQQNKDKIKEHAEIIEKLQNQINNLPSAGPVIEPIQIQASSGSSNVDMNQLAKMFVSHQTVADLEKRIKVCEGRNDTSEKLIGQHDKRLTELETFYRSLASSI